MKVETLEYVVRAMVPAVNRIDAESGLLKARREYHNETERDRDTEALVVASGAFYGRLSAFALEVHNPTAYDRLTRAWVDVAVAYDKGEDLYEPTYRMYAVCHSYRLLIDF